ncbi:MFS transporter [Baia soyae]|uniref:DHA1 family multidrug resistance protein B-like MFS transporter n=1 Tax=Baia soyae TaxID=1544746 RepID=A0A4R2RNZ9_9BACL|nr:MFS transporter [Baia soyae]TCP61541.1 DHA1 family multidrug resistance protein B-like MFS transporter [Baia soyae]
MKLIKLHTNIQIRLLDQFLRAIAFHMITPFMIIYFSSHFSQALTGVILMGNLVLTFITALCGGYFADQFSRKKIMVGAETTRFIAMVIMCIASTPIINSPVTILLMVIINSLCIGFARPAGSAMIADSSQLEERKYIFTLDYWFYNVAMCLGALAGGFFFKSYLSVLLILVATFSLFSLLLILFVIKDTYRHTHQATKERKLLQKIIFNYKNVLSDSVLRMFLLANLLSLSVQIQTMDFTVVRLANEMKPQSLFSFQVNGMEMFGVLNSINSLLVIGLGFFFTRLATHIRDTWQLTIGLLLYSVGFTIISISNSSYVLIIAMILVVIGELFYVPVKQSLFIDIVPVENRASYMATNDLGILGATLLGGLAVSLGAFFPSWIMGSLFFACGISSLILFGKIFARKKLNQVDTLAN